MGWKAVEADLAREWAAIPVEALQLVARMAAYRRARVFHREPTEAALAASPLPRTEAPVERAAVLVALAGQVDLVMVVPIHAGCRAAVLRPWA